MTTFRRLRWDAAVAVTLPLAILLLACASSSLHELRRIATTGRWVALIALAAFAVAHLVAERRPLPRVPTGWIVTALLIAVAGESAAWSVDPRVTLERVFTVGVVFIAAAALALAVPRVDVAATRALDGILAGAGAVALASLLVLAFAFDHAVQPATGGSGWRFQGLGENPNTVPMLLCVALPIAAWWSVARTGIARLLGDALVLLFVGELAAAGSRGAVIAAAGGTIVTVVACARTRLAKGAAVAVVVAVAVACLEFATLPSPLPAQPQVSSTGAAARPTTQTRGINAELTFRQQDEIGAGPIGLYQPPVRRTIFGSSGRAQAWSGAFKQGEQRPLVGYGFGTEMNVFVDRYNAFESLLVENGYLGFFLQLGAVGVILLLALLASLIWSGVQLLRSPLRAGSAAAASGVLVAAMLVEMSQTGFFSVGNIASAAIWISVFPLALLARTRA
jgi:hypothetical protein